MPSLRVVDQAQNRWMIVIAERHILWSLWCIDFVRNTAREGHEFVILDLSKFRPKRHKNNSKYFLTKLYRKNRIEGILQRVAEDLKIEIISPRKNLFQYKFPKNGSYRENSLSFLNGLDSQYFEEIGSRIINESQIAPRILTHSKAMYDKVFEITAKVIVERKVTKVIVPGGRTLIPNAITAATLSMETTCTVLEQVTSKSSRYLEFPIDFRQNMNSHQQEIDRTWAGGGALKYEIAKSYLQAKLHGGQMGRNFSVQFDSSLEISIPENKKLAAIFVGSGFEMVPSDDDIKSAHLGSEQQKSILRIFNQVALENGFTVVLRGHPSSHGLEKMFAAEDSEWAEFCKENKITHIPSLSKIDSYKLMKESDINVVYASTVGLDSIILGANTLILANTDWAHLVPEVCSFNEQSIRNRFYDLNRKVDIEQIYPYAFYMECGGIEMSNVDIRPDGSIYFEGNEIGTPRFRYLQKIFKR